MVRSGLDFWRAWLAIAIVLFVPGVAQAEIDIAIPSGWTEAAPGSTAAERADAWARGGATVQHVLATTIADDFAETLAVLSVPRALDPAELADPDLAAARLTEAGATLIGADAGPQEVRIVAVDGSTSAIIGRWEDESLAMRIALVPEGSTHAAIVLAVPRRMDVLYADVLDDALASLRGAIAPTLPFPRGRWLAFAWSSWLLGAIAGGVLVVRSVGDTPGPTVVARRVALVASACAGLVAIVVAIATADAAPGLAAAGTSATAFLVQVASGGLVIAALVLLGAAAWERRVRPIQSAPGEGTYGAWTRAPSGPRPVVAAPRPSPEAARPAGAAPVPPPIPISRAESEAFPAPGRSASAGELRLAPSDEPAAHLEHVGVPRPGDDEDEMASLATAEIRLDGKSPGGRFRPR